MTVEHLKRLENQRRGFAQVSELSGAQVEVKAEVIDDQGTAWRANSGQLKIDAQQHSMRAAETPGRTAWSAWPLAVTCASTPAPAVT